MAEQCKGAFTLNGDAILVEDVPQPEAKTKSGIVLSAGLKGQIDGVEMNKPLLVRVLLVGEGFYDDTNPEKAIPVDLSPGDIILIGKHDVAWFSTFGPIVTHREIRVGITRESAVKLRFKGGAGYDAVYDVLAAHAGEL